MKTLTKVAVMLVAIEMMKDQGTATTLEVKEALRAEGYFAKQADVSNLMFEVAQEENWMIDNSNIFRTYSLDAQNVAAKAPIKAHNQPSTLRFHTISHRDGSVVDVTEKNEEDAVIGDWVVETANELEMIFDSVYTRDEIRSAYAKINDVAFVDTRVKTIKE